MPAASTNFFVVFFFLFPIEGKAAVGYGTSDDGKDYFKVRNSWVSLVIGGIHCPEKNFVFFAITNNVLCPSSRLLSLFHAFFSFWFSCRAQVGVTKDTL